MQSADFERTTVDIAAKSGGAAAGLRATGSVLKFDGFLALYQESRDDEEDEDGSRLPPLTIGDALSRKSVSASQHFTEPPPRYTEATLVKKMEELGIGRPSTYAATLATLRDRDYVTIDKKRLSPPTRAASSPPSSKASSPATSNTTSRPVSRRPRPHLGRRGRMARGAAPLLEGLQHPHRRGEGVARRRGHRRPQRRSRGPHLPRSRRRLRSALLPACGTAACR
jgi:DNA topoisomerase I (EC 5.99.1.2)